MTAELTINTPDTAPRVTIDGRAVPCEFVPVRSMREPEEIEGYLAMWGSPDQRDCYGTYFSRDEPPLMDLRYVPIPLRYAHGQDPDIGKGTIGDVIKIWLDDKGIKFRAVLDKAIEGYQRISNEILRGVLGVSTGVPDYLADFAEDGRFVSWPIAADITLTDKPCERRMPAVAAVRSLDGQHIQLEVRPVPQAEAVTGGDPRDCGCDERADARATSQTETNNAKKGNIMAAKPTAARRADPAPAEVAAAQGGPRDNKRAGLTLALLGLDQNATLTDVYTALVGLLGDSAANAVMEDAMGPAEDAADATAMVDPSNMLDDGTEDDQRSAPAGDDKRSADLKATLQAMLQKQLQKPRSAPAPRTDELAELREQNRLLKRMMIEAEPADAPTPKTDRRDNPGNGQRQTPRIEARDLVYDMSSANDLAYAIKTLEAVGKRPSDSLVRAASYKIAHEIEKSTPVGSDMTVQFMTPFRSRDEVMKTDIKAYRANEVMGDGNTGFGSNYIGVFYDTALWLKIRQMPIWREMEARGMEEKVIPVGYASDVIPLEGADFSWYRVPETVNIDSTGRPQINIPASKAGTSAVTLTVRTLGALVYYSVLLDEDSIVPMAAELNRKANIQAQEQIEYVIFNGDTATGTGNLNSKNVTLAASDVTNFTVADGILKTAIIANAGAAARAASGLSDLDFQLLFGLLGNNGITGSDPTKLMFAVDPQSGLALDRLPIVKTKDINSAATVERGHALEMYGVPIFRSGQIALADSTGYVDALTASNNKYGRIACIRPDQWVLGFKRQVTMEYFRDVPGQSNGMVITMRLGLQVRDNTQAASASYNVTVK